MALHKCGNIHCSATAASRQQTVNNAAAGADCQAPFFLAMDFSALIAARNIIKISFWRELT